MAGFFGTEQQRALQQRTQSMRERVAVTPGLYNAGRFIGIDCPDLIPPGERERMLARDGLLGFRMISPSDAAALFPGLEAKGCRVDRWDIFVGTEAGAGCRAKEIANGPRPDGISIRPPLIDPEGADTSSLQQFLAAAGLAPFPGAMLVAEPPQSRTIVLGTAQHIVATGHAYFPHNAHSRFHRYAWIGLVTTAPAWRGKGLGRLVNALLVDAAFSELGASHVYEMVAPTNEPSRRMVQGCGLCFDPTLLCGVAVPNDSARFTR